MTSKSEEAKRFEELAKQLLSVPKQRLDEAEAKRVKRRRRKPTAS